MKKAEQLIESTCEMAAQPLAIAQDEIDYIQVVKYTHDRINSTFGSLCGDIDDSKVYNADVLKRMVSEVVEQSDKMVAIILNALHNKKRDDQDNK